MASRLGVSQQAYVSWEWGVKKPTQENLVKIAHIFTVSVDYLVRNSGGIKDDELDNMNILFRVNSKSFTDDKKEIFKNELIEFMNERKKLFKKTKVSCKR